MRPSSSLLCEFGQSPEGFALPCSCVCVYSSDQTSAGTGSNAGERGALAAFLCKDPTTASARTLPARLC